MMHNNNEPLFETLGFKDLEGQMIPVVGIDNYASKMGTDDQIIVLDFEVKSKLAADDLVNWFEKGYDFVLDADASPGEVSPNRYMVFVELRRRNAAVEKILNLVDDLGTLTEFNKASDWEIKVKDDKVDFSEEQIRAEIPLSPKEYREIKEKDLNEMRISAGIQPKPIYTDKKDQSIINLQSSAGII